MSDELVGLLLMQLANKAGGVLFVILVSGQIAVLAGACYGLDEENL